MEKKKIQQDFKFKKEFTKKSKFYYLYNKYYEISRNILNASLNKYDYNHRLLDYDDIIHITDEAFIIAIQKKYKSEQEFLKLFITIAYRKLIDELRKFNTEKRKIFKFTNYYESENFKLINNIADPDSNIEQIIINKIDNNKENLELNLRLKFLNKFYNTLEKNSINKKILFYKLRQYSVDDIAEILSINKVYIWKRWWYIKNKIKTNYKLWVKNILDKTDI